MGAYDSLFGGQQPSAAGFTSPGMNPDVLKLLQMMAGQNATPGQGGMPQVGQPPNGPQMPQAGQPGMQPPPGMPMGVPPQMPQGQAMQRMGTGMGPPQMPMQQGAQPPQGPDIMSMLQDPTMRARIQAMISGH